MAFLAKHDNLFRSIGPWIDITVNQMMNLKPVPFIRETTATILTSEIPLFDQRI
jgi:hypothetical protein